VLHHATAKKRQTPYTQVGLGNTATCNSTGQVNAFWNSCIVKKFATAVNMYADAAGKFVNHTTEKV
jgi:hypothetical protein